MVYFANLRVNRRDHLCDVARHVSAQSLDFLDLDEISSFMNWKHSHVLILRKARSWMDASWKPIGETALKVNIYLLINDIYLLQVSIVR